MSIRVESVTFPAHRCPRCLVIYPDLDGYALGVCYCRESYGITTETVPVECTVKYLDSSAGNARAPRIGGS